MKYTMFNDLFPQYPASHPVLCGIGPYRPTLRGTEL